VLETFDEAGVQNVTITVTDALGTSAEAVMQVEVASPLQAVLSAEHINVTAGSDLELHIQVSGGHPPYSFASGFLGVDPNTGRISGSVERTASLGDTNVSIRVTDALGAPVVQVLRLHVSPPMEQVQTTLSTTEGARFESQPPSVAGGAGRLEFLCLACNLPPGVRFVAETGQLASGGSALTRGQYGPFSVGVRDGNKAVYKLPSILLDVRERLQVVWDTRPPVQMTLGRPLALKAPLATVTGGLGDLDYVVSGSLPPGIRLDRTSGLLFGSPTLLGNYTFSIEARDQAGAMSVVLSDHRVAVVPPGDCEDSANGPNGLGCGLGACLDAVAFDNAFACDCSGLEGNLNENCVSSDSSTAEDSGGSSASLLAVVAPLAVLLVVCAVILVVQWRRHQRKVQLARDNLAALRETIEERLNTELFSDGGTKVSRSAMEKLEIADRSLLVIERHLGKGEFGEVELARLKDRQLVAVKKLRGNAEREQQEQFLMEVWLTASLEHPNIVKVLGTCTRDTPFLVALEYMAGGDLRTFLRAGTKPSTAALLGAASQLASALVYLSRRGIVHRDLAARNVLLATKGTLAVVKLADFGMSRGLEERDYYRQASDDRVPVKWLVSLTCHTSTTDFVAHRTLHIGA
jgi:tRNA A-37 threonylcarbamoyl transferase component Bud32